MSYNGLKLWIVNAEQRFDNFKIICDSFFFHDGLFYWSEMLLIGEIDMAQEWTFAWQERASNF
jgi:hypothetical protein